MNDAVEDRASDAPTAVAAPTRLGSRERERLKLLRLRPSA